MSPRALAAVFAAVAVVLLVLGVREDAWWTILGGVGAAAASAWLLTGPRAEAPRTP